VKLVIEGPESIALRRHLEDDPVLATSQIAIVEVSRATTLANPNEDVRNEVEALLASCMLIAVTAQLLRNARNLTSAAVRTLDAIHLASALRIDADELLAYDRRLLTAARAQGLAAVAPAGE
jgi:uncharacterized protein